MASKVDPLQCSLCPEVFDNFETLAAHVRLKHGPPRAEIPEVHDTEPDDVPTWQQPFSGSASGSFRGGVQAPREQIAFLNLAVIGNTVTDATIIEQRALQTRPNIAEGWPVVLDFGAREKVPSGKYLYNVVRDQQNHRDLFAAYGMQWVGRKVQVKMGFSLTGNARIQLVPLP